MQRRRLLAILYLATMRRRRVLESLRPGATRPAGCRWTCHGLQEDLAAVTAGLTLPWSQGPIEGQINRLKLLKRQMCGRARLDLLARRFLLAA
jgi:hypothetical protein